MINKSLFSSRRQNWRTPKELYNQLDKEFNFDYDPCLTETNTIHSIDMLGSDWGGEIIFVNPPYKMLSKWIEKCYYEWKKGKTIVMLIPARTDTKAFHEFIYPNAEIRFIKGRLCFDNSNKPAPFPSMIVIFRNS
jgi:site-specific DNA-methyltransferase (adenine-specific)